MIKFGIAGSDDEFANKGYKVSEQVPKYLDEMKLELFEYQCGRGVNVSEKKAELLKNEAGKYNIELSLHSPYYISLSTQEENKKSNTIKYIIDSARAADMMGAKRVVVHAGSLLNLDREYAVQSACNLLKRALEELEKEGLSHIILCPETMGKTNQLGDSKEIIKMCKVDDRLLPTIDFGHLNSRGMGYLRTVEDFENEIKMYIDELGYERMKHFHCHFSKQEYTENGGEKRHVTFSDEGYGPYFNMLAVALKNLKLEPHIICESAGTQGIDAKTMKDIYERV